MIEAERILMVHFNIHFLCASVWFPSGEVGVTRWERCSGEWCSGINAVGAVQCRAVQWEWGDAPTAVCKADVSHCSTIAQQ